MADPEPFEDPGPLVPQPPSRVRRFGTIAVLVLLIVSMVFLAFVSGRGFVTPVAPDRPEATLPTAGGSARPAAGSSPSMLAIVDAAGRLVTADADGHVSAPIGAAGIDYSFPTWSPDGARIAVIGDDAGTGVVHVFSVGRDVAGGATSVGPTAVYDSDDRPPFYVYWSPDGSRLSFLTHEPDGIALRLAPADATSPATIVREGAPLYWAWTDDDGILVHSGGRTADAFIGEVGLDGAVVQPSISGSGGFRAPAVTTDGAFRGYVAGGTQAADQVVVETRDGSGRHGIPVEGEAAIDFSPTASDLAFIAPDAPGSHATLPVGPLRILSATTGDIRVLLPGPVVAFFWSPDGRTIAALEVGQSTDGGVAGLERDGWAQLARAPGAVAPGAAAAPGVGVRLVFVDSSTGTIVSKRNVRLADLFVAQLLPFFDQYALSHRTWSADSGAIALPIVADDGTSQIVAIPADGSAATRIADGVAAAWSP